MSPASAEVTVRAHLWRGRRLWLALAKACFALGEFFLSRIGFDVKANGHKVGSRRMTGTVTLKVDE